ncbi:MAG: hypothetical protein JRD49_01650, partial [Deltaproteobacteria bacterium]|nr:hypothetical protein [Deltaproteobacteria bacterium]
MRWKITILNTVGNLIGALLTFLYLNYLDVGGHQYSGEDPSLPYMIYFVIGTGSIFVMVILFVQHWTRPLYAFTAGNIQLSDLDPYAAKQLRKKALQLVPVMTAASLFGWLMAGFIFGMFMPIIMTMFFGLPETSLTESMRTFFGIFFIGGSITGLFVYFSTESVWRKGLSAFFP